MWSVLTLLVNGCFSQIGFLSFLFLLFPIGEEDDLSEQLESRQQLQQIRKLVDTCLTDQERQVISLRYGLYDDKPQRQREVAKIVGISCSYVSRIEKRALEKLREALE